MSPRKKKAAVVVQGYVLNDKQQAHHDKVSKMRKKDIIVDDDRVGFLLGVGERGERTKTRRYQSVLLDAPRRRALLSAVCAQLGSLRLLVAGSSMTASWAPWSAGSNHGSERSLVQAKRVDVEQRDALGAQLLPLRVLVGRGLIGALEQRV